MKWKSRHLKYLFSGALFPDTTLYPLDTTLVDTSALPEYSCGFSLIENDLEVARFYTGGKVYSKEDLASKAKNKGVISKMESAGWEHVIFTLSGSFAPFIVGRDHILKSGVIVAF